MAERDDPGAARVSVVSRNPIITSNEGDDIGVDARPWPSVSH